MTSTNSFRIGELSKLTGVKAGTIRFYERCGLIAPAKRLPNGYRMFDEKHIDQVRICRLVFGGFVNKRLRKISMELIWAAKEWNLAAYQKAAEEYLQAVREDIEETKKAVDAIFGKLKQEENPAKETFYTKKQAAALLKVTPESIRNWERNGLLGNMPPYQKRFYSSQAIDRMYVIRLLLDNGYSMMAVRRFFAEFDAGNREAAAQTLIAPGKSETLIYRADRYMETLLHTQEKARQLLAMLDKMRRAAGSKQNFEESASERYDVMLNPKQEQDERL